MADHPASPEQPADAARSREEKIAALRAKVEAMKAARAAATAGAPAAAAKPAAAVDVPVSSLNPGGRPGSPPKAATVEALGTINNSVELRAEATEDDNIKKLLGGLGAYQNPLRRGVWQLDYRYYAEARRRLEAAGYTVVGKDYLGRPLQDWTPVARGWTRVRPT
ncbi:MAG: hypothetical protein QN183_08955 [Armatimonadota bacterium]|nr:hypothetical protein [Armatimonadota bacterium]MDR7533360.1 hypothetical protein [Armatimonadota bacterium]MDR7536480.1 hypothetical protein [Armatimonadota bacterium]